MTPDLFATFADRVEARIDDVLAVHIGHNLDYCAHCPGGIAQQGTAVWTPIWRQL